MAGSDVLSPGTTLGAYKIESLLGSGGMADVYRATDTRLGRIVALKVLPPEFGRDQNLRARFEREVKQCAALSHRNIVTLFEVGTDGHYHFYTMQLLPGGDLAKRIRQGMDTATACKILREVSSAFSHAHRQGLVHRDVKPENIVFDENDQPVLTDFGIAKAVNSATKMTKTGMSVGTPCYISPEQARGKHVDGRSDLYSLGIIFYEMLTGDVPYKADDALATIVKHMTEPLPKLPAQFMPFQPLLEKLLAKDPAKRFADADELIRALDAVDTGAPPPRHRAGSTPPAGEDAATMLKFPSHPRAPAVDDDERTVMAPPKTAQSRPRSVSGGGSINVPRRKPVEVDRSSRKRKKSGKGGGTPPWMINAIFFFLVISLLGGLAAFYLMA